MKTTFNLTTSRCDLDRFSDRQALVDLMVGFDGVELMCFEEDHRQIIPPERVKPEYLTFEFITETLEQHKDFLSRQRIALGMR